MDNRITKGDVVEQEGWICTTAPLLLQMEKEMVDEVKKS